MSERLELCAPNDLGAFVQLLRDVLEEGMQHPEGEGLVDRHQHDDRRRQDAPPRMFHSKKGSMYPATSVIGGIARKISAMMRSQKTYLNPERDSA